ncbi:MAG: PEGA domain-containing protein [Polyangiaceae bacterium]
MTLRVPATLLVGVAALALAGAAWAGPERADELLDRGIALREQGKDDEALALFREALAERPTARARAQVALAEQALGMWVKAEADLTAALEARDDPWIAKNRAALEGALAIVAQHVGTLEVRASEPADLYLDGVRVGSTRDKTVRAAVGRYALEVRAPGFQTATRTVEIRAGGVTRETLTLTLAPREPAPRVPGAKRAPDAPTNPAPSDGSAQRGIGWVVLGTGGALLATGAVGMLVRGGIIDDYNRDCPGLGAAQQPPECDAKIDSARTWLTVSVVSLVGGGVLTLGGAGLVLLAPRSAPKTAVGLTCGLSGPGLACGGRFF